MAVDTITKIWASSSPSNRKLFNDDEIGAGIQYEGPVVSNELNGIANRTDIMVDNLQRGCTPWNPNKVYGVGDIVALCVSIGGTSHLCFVESTSSKNSSLPLAGYTSHNADALFASFVFDSFNAIREGTSWRFKSLYLDSINVKSLSTNTSAVLGGNSVNITASSANWEKWEEGTNGTLSVEDASSKSTIATKGWVSKYIENLTAHRFVMISAAEFEKLAESDSVDPSIYYFIVS